MAKLSAYGSMLLMDGDPIAQVTGLSGPNLSADTVDVTTHDQAEAWEEHVPTILRSGTVTFNIVYDPALADHIAVLAQMVDKDFASFELRFPNPTHIQFVFNAFVTGFTPSAPVDGALTAALTLKITGEPTLYSVYSP